MKENLVKRVLAVLFAVVLAFSLNTNVANAASKTVKIDPTKPIRVDGGQITGSLSKDKTVAIYKGIPFAAPPVGKLRWKAPQPVVAWKGVKKCTNFSASAIQPAQAPFMFWSKEFIIDTTKGYSEDCLYLNVWTKKVSSVKKRPVIVYIHGGGNGSGGASCEVYDGEGIAKKDAVYVSINYRVGIFGFLAHPDLTAESPDKVSGNYAIQDMIASLKWVKNNIAKFGGDPDNVTIAGQSAGSMDVLTLVSSPLAKGLFKNAVAMSGNTIAAPVTTLADKEKEGAKAFTGKTLAEMRAMTTDQILGTTGVSAATCIDGKVLTGSVLDAYRDGSANDVNLMVGMVDGDIGAFPIVPSDAPFFTVPKVVAKDKYEAAIKTVFGSLAKTCLAAYPATSEDAIATYKQINIDGFVAQGYFLAKARTLNSKNSTYIYQFSHIMPGPQAVEMGAFHTVDVPYWLNHFSSLRDDYWAKIDNKIGDMMSSYLVNFAKTGDPNGKGLPKWKAFKEGNLAYNHIADTTTFTTLTPEQSKLWKDYYGALIPLTAKK